MKHLKNIRNIYQQRTKIQLQCRACLTLSNNVMFNLEENISLEENLVGDRTENLSIREALEKITSSKVVMKKDYPQYICPVCLSFLKITLKFILQYEETQKKIDFSEHTFMNEEKHVKKKVSNTELKSNNVDIIFGQNKYSLSDVIVVEDEEKEQSNYKGFLNNLGKEVSASFIDKNQDVKLEPEISSNEVSIALIENNKLLTVKEVRLNEDTNEIEYIVDDIDFTDEKKEIVNIPDKEDTSQLKIVELSNLDEDNIESYIIETASDVIDNCKENSLSKQNRTRVRKRPLFQDKNLTYPCDLCKKIYVTFRSLKSHQKRVHFKIEREYLCGICGYKNNTLSGHKHHMNKHNGKKWVCSICHKLYYTKAVLKNHMESHHNRRQFLCNVCGKGFNYANALTYHMRLHTGEKKYVCHICSRRYRMPNGLKRHILTHTGEKPFKCKYCGKPFFSRSETKAHELTHTDIRPYHCVYCDKGFIKTHNMKVHLLGHSGPFKCDMCAKTFANSDILSFHYKFTHKIKPEASDTEEQESDDN